MSITSAETIDEHDDYSGSPRKYDDVALVSLLKDCARQKQVPRGRKLHVKILKSNLLHRNIFIGNTLIFMYAKCGALAKAQQVFDELPFHTLVSWTALITGFSQYGLDETAIATLEQMQEKGFFPDEWAFASTLKACAGIAAAEKGFQIHADSIRCGFLGDNIVLGGALVDMYAKCGALAKAQQVFDELPQRGVVSWNALITGYCQHGHGQEAIECFERMQADGLSPDGLTYSCVLKACGSIGSTKKSIELHTEIARIRLLENDTVTGNALVDAYAKCGAISKAKEVFDNLLFKNVVSWTALIIGYCQCGYENEAVSYFENMKCDGLSPDSVTLACMLQACGSMRAADLGGEIHGEIIRNGLLARDVVLGNMLVDMYMKCGALMKARQTFDKLLFHDLVSWNVLIAGYCEHGKAEEALACFDELIQHNQLCPDNITFALVLRACLMAGNVDKGKAIYDNISSSYGMIPTLEHNSYMVDLFGRAGQFDRAMSIMEKIACSDRLPAWLALLGSCLQWGNKKLGRVAFESLVQLDDAFTDVCFCISRIYKNASMWKNAEEIEMIRECKESRKCCIEYGKVHGFISLDREGI
ncbi:hypothetical protein KP509_12G084400 [Ceratopteris richardii]|uniref:Pentatricopeptide repeat-containing protein n=1 Tax=Ceratopteris richardii TaxID=49495 RepID=A0A8T2TKX8_CERRI|nr:hypothetical protein KP509_12G084400 [Ceratopteris richardii]KAH7423988.1 hypothetical protein KP509_12G084400 [Ceratopteris richardii]